MPTAPPLRHDNYLEAMWRIGWDKGILHEGSLETQGECPILMMSMSLTRHIDVFHSFIRARLLESFRISGHSNECIGGLYESYLSGKHRRFVSRLDD